MNDILSLFENKEIAEAYVKKIYQVIAVVLICTIIFALIDLLDWYKFIENAPAVSKLPHPFYRYKLWPIIGITELLLNITVNAGFYHAWSNLKAYFETSDDILLQKGFKYFYTSAVALLIWLVISILNISYRTFFL